MIKLGITGGIGAGKSVVATFLNTMGIPVYIADAEAKKITATSHAIREKLLLKFGAQIYFGNELNKDLFASLIFENKDALKAANAIIHPEVLNDFELWCQKQPGNIVAMESAILFESGFHVFVDKIITVTAPLEMRIQRVMTRPGMTMEVVKSRISSQLPDEYKTDKSDWVVQNDNLQPIIPQIEKILECLVS